MIAGSPSCCKTRASFAIRERSWPRSTTPPARSKWKRNSDHWQHGSGNTNRRRAGDHCNPKRTHCFAQPATKRNRCHRHSKNAAGSSSAPQRRTRSCRQWEWSTIIYKAVLNMPPSKNSARSCNVPNDIPCYVRILGRREQAPRRG
jgi:hypothetical protein